MLRWARLLLPLAALVPSACNPLPDEVTTGASSSSDTSAGTVTPGTTTATTTPTAESSGLPASETAMDTTMGAVDATTSETSETSSSSGGSSSSGPLPECDEGGGCGSNEECDDGVCVEACGGTWGDGRYGYCLTEYGDFDTDAICGPNHVCVFWEDRAEEITQTTCALQGCVDACDCPPPPSTGNAVVACGDITHPPEMNDCYLTRVSPFLRDSAAPAA
jgi:hypothetical protein